MDIWQLGGEWQEIEKERMDRVGDWMSKPEGRAIAGWCIYRTESKNKRNYRAACEFVFLWVKSAVPQQIRNNTVAISLPAALYQHICRCPHICSVFPFDILPLFFNARPILLSTRNPTLIATERCHRGWALCGWGCWDLVNLWEAFKKTDKDSGRQSSWKASEMGCRIENMEMIGAIGSNLIRVYDLNLP